jgi:hypothetical protein
MKFFSLNQIDVKGVTKLGESISKLQKLTNLDLDIT